MEEFINVSNNIRKYRKRKNLTQAQLAEHLCVTSQNVSKWEKGLSMPDISNLWKLAQFFSVSLEEMSRIFDASKNNSKRLKFAQKVNEEIFELKKPKGNTLVRELLESEYSRDYVRNFKGIKSYLILNKDNSLNEENPENTFNFR